jgi:myo-inositol 2-dehydrogenase/D-chiro-inositol 1-dehydrogenase
MPELPLSRRDFTKTAALAGAGFLLTPRVARAVPLPGERAPLLRIGVVGCGGRGTGAVRDIMRAGDDDIVLVAMGDLFPDRLMSAQENLAKLAADNPSIAAKYKVTPEMSFSGFDAYQKVLATDIDLVILATPPGFRPMHLEAAVNAGKHVFAEKPVAVDAAGVRRVIAAARVAEQKKLAIVAGTQRRHDPAYVDVIGRVQQGAIGDVMTGQVFWNQGGLWNRDRLPEWSDTEWQLRNWLYLAWLSGDHIVEQHIHNIDVGNWVMGGHPVRATGVGGRAQRTDPKYGHIFDHFMVDFEYADGRHVTSMCRQIEGSANFVGERFQGSKGHTDANKTIVAGGSTYTYAGPTPNPFVNEHTDLLASIRAGKPLNEGVRVAESTLSAIMGREAAYTGQTITWDALLNSAQDLAPPSVAFGAMAMPPVPVPGRTKLERSFDAGW